MRIEVIFSHRLMRTLYLLFTLTLLLSWEASAQSLLYGTASYDSLLSQNQYRVASNPQKVLRTAQSAQVHALRENDSILFARALTAEGQALFYQTEIDRALSKLNQAISVFEEYDNSNGILSATYQLAVIEAATGHSYPALSKLKKCLSLSRTDSLQSWQVRVLYQIALINFRQGELRLAWDRTESALKIDTKSPPDPRLKSKIHILRGNLLLKNDELQLAGNELEKAELLASKVKDSTAFLGIYNARGGLALRKGRLEEAVENTQKALRLSQKVGVPGSYPENLVLSAKVSLAQGAKEEALEKAREAERLSALLQSMPALKRETARTLSDILLLNGDSSKAFVYSRIAKKIEDSALTDQVNTYVLWPGKEEQAHEVDDSKTASQALTEDNVALAIIGSLLFICALLTIALISRKGPTTSYSAEQEQRPTQTGGDRHTPPTPSIKENEELTQEREAEVKAKLKEMEEGYLQKLQTVEQELANQKQVALEKEKIAEERENELNARNKHFEDMDKTKNKVFSVLTHDLRQPINQIKSVLTLLEMEELDGDDRREIVEKLKESVDNSSNALENLLLWSKKQLTGINTRIVDVHLLPQVWQLESHLKPNLEAKELKLAINIPDFFKVKADMNQLDICLRNLVTNAIKFSNRGDTITIDAIEENGQKVVRVIDQGVGMNPEQLEKLRTLSENFSTLGTMNEKGTGLGILITREFMENQKGRLEIMSRKGEGSIFSLIFSSGSASRTPEHSESKQI